MRKTNKYVLVSDFETTATQQFLNEKCTRVYSWVILNTDISAKPLEISALGVDIESWFEFISNLKLPTTENNEVLIYFHNATFDCQFILHYLLKLGYTQTLGEIIDKNKEFTAIINDFSSIYELCLKFDNYTLRIRDSLKVLPVSIDVLGKNLGLKKLKETHDYQEFKNYNSVDELTEEEREYVYRDAYILKKSIEGAYARGLKSITLSSSVYKKFKRLKGASFSLLNEPKDDVINGLIDLCCKGGFCGGNEKFKGKLLHGVISLDFNSLYPSVMYNDTMPVGIPKLVKSFEDANRIKYEYPLRMISVVIQRVEIIDSFIPFIGSKRKMFSGTYDYDKVLESKHLVLWEDEYKLFTIYYAGVYQVESILCFKQHKSFFKDFIRGLMDEKENISKRLNALKEKNDEYYKLTFERFLVKREMNALSGVFGMRKNRESKRVVGLRKINRNINNEIIELEIPEYETYETEGEYHYRAIYSKITSGGRVRLINIIESHTDKVIYWDTDSIYLYTKSIPDDIISMCDDNEIGKLKYEGYYKSFKYLRAKSYIKSVVENGKTVRKISLAGANDEVKKLLNFKNFDYGFRTKEAVCKKFLRVTGGAIIVNQPFEIGIEKEKHESNTI